MTVQTTDCWCVACDPQRGEIGLECKNAPITTYAEVKADKYWGEIAEAVHDRDGHKGFQILKTAIQEAVNEGEALAYAKRNARI